jgi:hypothetical protein
MLLDACIGALLLHGGEVLDLEVDDALFVAGLPSLVHEVTDCVEMLSLRTGYCLHLFKN